jgi:hypothetical protein
MRFIHSTEVINMLVAGWDWEKCIEVRSREAREEGEKRGEKKEAQEVLNLINSGYTLDDLKKRLTAVAGSKAKK